MRGTRPSPGVKPVQAGSLRWPPDPAAGRDAQQRFALPQHGRPVLSPVRVLTGDRPVVGDQGVHRRWHVNDLCIAIDLHPGATEIIREDDDADARIPAGIAGLRASRVGGDNETSGLVNAARHRRRLRAATGTGRDDDGVVTRPDELEQLISGNHGIRCDLRIHQLTIPSGPEVSVRHGAIGGRGPQRPGSQPRGGASVTAMAVPLTASTTTRAPSGTRSMAVARRG
jgi:hypothetical protein